MVTYKLVKFIVTIHAYVRIFTGCIIISIAALTVGYLNIIVGKSIGSRSLIIDMIVYRIHSYFLHIIGICSTVFIIAWECNFHATVLAV